MRARELRERNTEELVRMQSDIKEKLFKARLQNATHQLTNTSEVRKGRREFARIMTILNERQGEPAAAGDTERSAEE